MDIARVWHWIQRIGGTSIVVCLSLYVVRCAVTVHILNLDQFDGFLRGLVRYIFN